MNLILEVLSIILLFSIFAFIHSYLASISVKKYLIEKLPGLGAFYRIFYNLFALISFLLIYWLSPEPDEIIYDLNFPFDIIIIMLQVFSFAGLIWTATYTDLGEFAGLKQIDRYNKGKYNPETLDEISKLNTTGPYKFSRHPLYLFIILFLIFRPVMDLAYLTYLICFIAYFYIGAFYEEKKLIEKFGIEYQKYKENVPSIFPLKIIK